MTDRERLARAALEWLKANSGGNGWIEAKSLDRVVVDSTFSLYGLLDAVLDELEQPSEVPIATMAKQACRMTGDNDEAWRAYRGYANVLWHSAIQSLRPKGDKAA